MAPISALHSLALSKRLMSTTKFSFVAKLFGQMKEMSIKEINGGREYIRSKSKLQAASIMQTW
jgi:hypothetical protein